MTTSGSSMAIVPATSSAPSPVISSPGASSAGLPATPHPVSHGATPGVPPPAPPASTLGTGAIGVVPPLGVPPSAQYVGVPPGTVGVPPGNVGFPPPVQYVGAPNASILGAGATGMLQHVTQPSAATDASPLPSATMDTIFSDAAIYSDALAASLRYPGYNYPPMSGLPQGTYHLALGFPRAPHASTSSLPYGGALPYNTTPSFPPQQQPPFYGAGQFPNTALPSIVTIASAITIKLASDNYMFWRAQVGPLLRSHILMGYVDGSFVCPDPHVVVSHAGSLHSQPNPAHQHWTQQDQSILSGFVSSITEGVLGMIMFAGTSREAWETLSGAFASTSIAHASALRQEMADLKKDNKTINVYFHQMKALSDSLTSIGMPLRDDEFISSILAGLGEEYDALFEVVNARTTPMQIRDLFSQLQATEQRKLAQRRTHGGAAHYPAAHAAASTPAGPVAAWTARGSPRPSAPPPKTAPPPTAPKPTAGRGSVVCQLCGVPRHTASRCYKRFNRDFLGIGNDGRDTEKQLSMAMTASHGSSSGAPQVADPAWYADSGATHHITHELDKLTSREPYHGTDQVHTANGSSTGRGGRLEILIPHTPPRDVDQHAPIMHGLLPMHGSSSGCAQPCTSSAPASPTSGSVEPCSGLAGGSASSTSGSVPACKPAPSLAAAAPDVPAAAGSLHAMEQHGAGSLDATAPLHVIPMDVTRATRTPAAATGLLDADTAGPLDTTARAPASRACDCPLLLACVPCLPTATPCLLDSDSSPHQQLHRPFRLLLLFLRRLAL
ncbi:hypothetical protein QYE76_052942 [Lolium multiflorum]|uniref:Retrotransposon Copia-like N-terminal domain-containing protein n=1 Tax=Lolium multiflorum TaxID=4521 RepID=A0AAD8SUP1_LOLMU|nr:hypothetical protein QYE76_052942 [Lolium multiflorum]